MRRQRHDLLSHDPGWTPLGEEKGNAFGQALRDAVKAAKPRTSGRNIYRLIEGQEVSLHQGKAKAAHETVSVLPSGVRVVDRRRVR